eukprot:364212-Chlamydomonas_euryale.AAC.3
MEHVRQRGNCDDDRSLQARGVKRCGGAQVWSALGDAPTHAASLACISGGGKERGRGGRAVWRGVGTEREPAQPGEGDVGVDGPRVDGGAQALNPVPHACQTPHLAVEQHAARLVRIRRSRLDDVADWAAAARKLPSQPRHQPRCQRVVKAVWVADAPHRRAHTQAHAAALRKCDRRQLPQPALWHAQPQHRQIFGGVIAHHLGECGGKCEVKCRVQVLVCAPPGPRRYYSLPGSVWGYRGRCGVCRGVWGPWQCRSQPLREHALRRGGGIAQV